MNAYHGSCHCEENTFILHSNQKPEDFIPRCDASSCSFCKKNDGVWISDPKGQLEIQKQKTSTYLFNSKIVDFHFCTTCGTLCYALFEKKYAVARVSCFSEILNNCQEGMETKFDGEAVEEGKERRRKNWTPVKQYNG